jgi:hypothetical protein
MASSHTENFIGAQLHGASLSPSGMEDNFSFQMRDLPVRRAISHHVSLNEFKNIQVVARGSSSEIFSATWKDQEVIIKVFERL